MAKIHMANATHAAKPNMQPTQLRGAPRGERKPLTARSAGNKLRALYNAASRTGKPWASAVFECLYAVEKAATEESKAAPVGGSVNPAK